MNAAALDELRPQLRGAVSTSPADLQAHSRDESTPSGALPSAVVYASCRDDVVKVLRWSGRHQVPVIPFGKGTSIEGHVVPSGSEVCLDLSAMNQILEVEPDGMYAMVQPGVTRSELDDALRYSGLFFPVDPGADASLGGMAATGASGTTTVRYGGMRANTLALEVVLGTGEVLRLGRPVAKSSSGYDLKDLFVGSAGTLGVITELVVRLHPRPDLVEAQRAYFADIAGAVSAATAIIASGLPVARLELLDTVCSAALNRRFGTGQPERPALYVELHQTTREGQRAEAELAQNLLQSSGGSDITTFRTGEERSALRAARHQLLWAIIGYFPGRRYRITDTAVPIKRLPEHAAEISRLAAEMDLDVAITGHVGDGNIHTVVATAAGQEGLAGRFGDALVEHALAMGGTCTGEHGIGTAKLKYLSAEHGPAAVWMGRVKALFDPDGLLNPGKVIPLLAEVS